jgi:hypothetical protein
MNDTPIHATTIDDDDLCFAAWKETILNLVGATREAIRKLAESYIAAPKHWQERLQEELPKFPTIFWRRLAAIGSNEVDERLLYMRNALGQRLERLPLRTQIEVLDHGVDYVGNSGEVLHACVETLDQNRELIKRVFADSYVRKPEEQRAWLEAQKTTVPSGKVARPILEERNGRCRINPPNGGAPFEVTKQEVSAIFHQLFR